MKTAVFSVLLWCGVGSGQAFAEYAGQGNFSPLVRVSGSNCQGIDARMSMSCPGYCQTTDIQLKVRNDTAYRRELTVKADVRGAALLHGGYVQRKRILVGPHADYAGTVVRIFTAADRADLDITDCRVLPGNFAEHR